MKVEMNGLVLGLVNEQYDQLSKRQLETINEYDVEQKAKGNGFSTRKNRIQFLMLFARETGKEFDDITKKDINKFLARKETTPNTLNSYKSQIKHFFKWLGKEDMVKHLIQKRVEDIVESKALWTEEEIQKLIETATHPRDKCFVALLYDLAIERKAIVEMSIKDVEIIANTVYVTVTGKRRGGRTRRRLQCISSAPYLIDWLNCHPYKDNPEAPVFISLAENSYGQRVHYNFTYQRLQWLAKKAGMKKKIRPHLIRHSKLTDLYRKGFNGIALQRYAGWVNGNMEQRYINLTAEEMDKEREAIERGVEYKPPEAKPSEMLAINCPRCKHVNKQDAKYCEQCWLPLNVEISTRETLIIELLRSKFYKSMVELDGRELDIEALAEEYDKLLKEAGRKGRKKISK